MRGKTIVGDIVKHWHRLAAGKLTIGFAPSISASRAYVEAFQASGVTSSHIDGTTPKSERKAICEAFCSGEIKVLFNVAIMEEGFDVSSYGGDGTVECLINARPTKSLRLARQINGRVLRAKPYPAIILDHAGQFTRTGMPDDIIKWSLTEKAKNMSRAGRAQIQQCSRCDAVYPPADVCPYCGFHPEVQERRLRYTEGQLQEITKSNALEKKQEDERQKIIKNRERKDAKTLPQLIAFAEKYGYDYPVQWAERWMEMRARHGG